MNRFNPSLRSPLFDIVVAALVVCAAGYFWFRSDGRAQLNEAHAEALEWREANLADLAGTQSALEDARRELEEIEQLERMRADHGAYLLARIEEEERRIDEARERDEPLVMSIQKLDTDILNLRRHRTDYVGRVESAAAALEGQRTERLRLETLAGQRGLDLTDADLRLAAPPPSHFPLHIGIDLFVESRARGDFGLISLSRTLRSIGPVDAGLIGSLGMLGGGDFAILEGGVFFNLPIFPERFSFDLEAGMSRLQARGGEGSSETENFWGARVRFAPLRHERLYLLVGMRDGELEDPSLRAGIAFGRR